MSEIRRTNQGGSIVTFIIVGVILAFGLIGTVYVLGQHGAQVRKQQAIAEAEKQANESAEKTKTDNSNKNKVTDDSTKTTSATAQNLPTTGPELAISELVGVYMLAATITSYVSSRRNLARYL